MIRTMSIKTPLNPEDYSLWFKQCADMFNRYVEWAFAVYSYNKNKAHKELYEKFRIEYPTIPSALVQCVRDVALESVKREKFKHKPNTRKGSSLRLNKCLISLKRNIISVIHPGKRIKFNFEYPEYFTDYKNAKFRSATLKHRKTDNVIVLNLQFEFPDTPTKESGDILGVDRGLYNIIACSNGLKIKGNQIRARQRRDLFNKRNIQAKGTKSSKRKLKKQSGGYARFSSNVNHCISKQLTNIPNVRTIVFENLKGVGTKKKGKKLNKWIHSWSFYQLQTFTEYKALAKGMEVKYVDPRYTSQKCSKCGFTDKDNRNKHVFRCKHCGYTYDADLNASLNIKQNYILSLANREQASVNKPNVAGLAPSYKLTSLSSE